MHFEQFYLGCLAHASYMLASEGEAVVVDPQRDVEIYFRLRRRTGFPFATFSRLTCTLTSFPDTESWRREPARTSTLARRQVRHFPT